VLIDGTDGSINDATGITSDGTSLYWCDRGFEAIYKASINGGAPVKIIDVVQATGDNFFGTWDIVYSGGKIYWTGVFGPGVYSANPDGTGVTPVLANAGTIGANRPFGITEYEGTIYFGDSEQLSTAIYSVGTGGQNPQLLVDGSSDDRYPCVLPPTAAPAPRPRVTSFSYDGTTGMVEISITGAPGVEFQVRESTELSFSAGAGASLVLVGGAGSDPVVLATDGDGVASGSFRLDPSRAAGYIRVEQVP